MALKQQTNRSGFTPIVNTQAHALIFRQVAKNAAHEVFHAVGAIDPAEKRLPPLLNSARRYPIAIDRDIHECTRLNFGGGFLHEDNLTRENGFAGVSRPFHGGSSHGLGEHVVAEGAQVAVPKRFEVDDRCVDRSLAGRAHCVFWISFAANAGDVGGQLIGSNNLGKPNPLDAGNTALHAQCLDVVPPCLAIYASSCCKEPCAASKNQCVGIQSLVDFEDNLIAGESELLKSIGFAGPLDLEADECSEKQSDDENRPCVSCLHGEISFHLAGSRSCVFARVNRKVAPWPRPSDSARIFPP